MGYGDDGRGARLSSLSAIRRRSENEVAFDASSESGLMAPFTSRRARGHSVASASEQVGISSVSAAATGSDDEDLDDEMEGDRAPAGSRVERADGSVHWTAEQLRADAERTTKIVTKLINRTAILKHSNFSLGRCTVWEVVRDSHDIVTTRGSLVKPGFAKVKYLECSTKRANADWEFANGQDMIIGPSGKTRFESVSEAVLADEEFYYVYADLLKKK